MWPLRPHRRPSAKKHALVFLTECKQLHGTPPASTKEPVHSCSFHRFGLVSFHFLLTDEFPDKLHITERRFGKVFIHRTYSCIAQKTVGGTSRAQLAPPEGGTLAMAQHIQWCESLLRNTRLTFDQAIVSATIPLLSSFTHVNKHASHKGRCESSTARESLVIARSCLCRQACMDGPQVRRGPCCKWDIQIAKSNFSKRRRQLQSWAHVFSRSTARSYHVALLNVHPGAFCRPIAAQGAGL